MMDVENVSSAKANAVRALIYSFKAILCIIFITSLFIDAVVLSLRARRGRLSRRCIKRRLSSNTSYFAPTLTVRTFCSRCVDF